jgi:hypothetical protein
LERAKPSRFETPFPPSPNSKGTRINLMSFYHNRHFGRKKNSVNRAKNNFPPEYSFNPLTYTSLPADKSDDPQLDIERAHFRTMMLVISLRQVADDGEAVQ